MQLRSKRDAGITFGRSFDGDAMRNFDETEEENFSWSTPEIQKTYRDIIKRKERLEFESLLMLRKGNLFKASWRKY